MGYQVFLSYLCDFEELSDTQLVDFSFLSYLCDFEDLPNANSYPV